MTYRVGEIQKVYVFFVQIAFIFKAKKVSEMRNEGLQKFQAVELTCLQNRFTTYIKSF